jgi:hypothetical protein
MTENAVSFFGFFLTSWKRFSFSSWPGLSRPSTSFLFKCSEDVDARDKPGHGELYGKALFHGLLFGLDPQDEVLQTLMGKRRNQAVQLAGGPARLIVSVDWEYTNNELDELVGNPQSPVIDGADAVRTTRR